MKKLFLAPRKCKLKLQKLYIIYQETEALYIIWYTYKLYHPYLYVKRHGLISNENVF